MEAAETGRYTEMVAVAEWSPISQMGAVFQRHFEALQIEKANYFSREVVRRTDGDRSVYVFAKEDLEHSWNAMTGKPREGQSDVDIEARAITALIVYCRLRRGPEWLTVDQFFDRAGRNGWDEQRAKFGAQLRELYAAEDHVAGAPPYLVELSTSDGTVRRTPTLPRCLLIALLHGRLEDALPHYGSDDQ